MTAKTMVDLLIIDPQNDFCDPKGSLYVGGAEHDMSRLAKMINRLGTRLHNIHVTMDSHHWMDIAHPAFWVGSDGKNPDPFTVISVGDVENGVWRPKYPVLNAYALSYVKELATKGKYALIIWPPHCLIGSPGHNVYPELYTALLEWERANSRYVEYVTKGSNFKTEHYSAIRAEVVDPSDDSTDLNMRLIEALQKVDEIAIAGEALSHCVKFTITDIADNIGDEHIQKFVLLTDASSSVASYEAEGDQFIKDMVSRGMKVSTTEEYLK